MASLPYEIPTFEHWSPTAVRYHPLQAGSIDGTDVFPHDKGIRRALGASYRPNKKVTGDPVKVLFVGHLDGNTKESTIRENFSKFGEVENCRLVRDIITGNSRRYAFVEFKRERDARIAWREMNKAFIDGAEILVEFEQERVLKGWIPRRFGGGFGGRKESGQLRFGGRDRPFRRPLPVGENPLMQNRSYQSKERSEAGERDRGKFHDRRRREHYR
eukprot:gene5218-359_t